MIEVSRADFYISGELQLCTRQSVQSVRRSDGKGRHTTTVSELLLSGLHPSA
jgi:putative ribosome biogenesis GTPase RsgA